ncbi:MAG: electron transporter RnfE [Candidatus Taylorbacteria bacterium CG11_big_fil_rev_8_21_14_0_20_46_11]|uniref:Electron transporter RnfE n=1 Tax=Candidatus Taylorbacteria bacterium CG11_big_fil_rev_8_21_14_0_20_46_11 TaxID=1975025 RepID=A0A2H0KBS0_9BACT|nr:MAG: electron transporter RnfE [Candidatus Taylorbacteria bacterium CG11_big_fil_rev_8_21_14_0_20_46_11]
MMYGYGLEGGWYGHTMFGGLFMVIVWVAVIWLVVWLVRGGSCASCKRSEHSEPHAKTALDILNERYAKGEIDRKEFEEKKKDVTS